MSDQRYLMRGVSASKEDVHNAIKNIDKGLYPKAFCKIIPDILGGDPDYCNIMHADGAGTKSSLAYLYWKETGDLSVWKGIAQDALIMNIDDLLCVGAVDNILVSSTIGRNKMLIPGEVISAIINGTDELLAELRNDGRGRICHGWRNCRRGRPRAHHHRGQHRNLPHEAQTTWWTTPTSAPATSSWASPPTGRLRTRKQYNGGMGSNGLTSARHDVFAKYLALPSIRKASMQPSLQELIYSGGMKLTDPVEGSPLDAGKLVLSPTRTYAPFVKQLLDAMRGEIHGMVHCSGGAQTKVLHFRPKRACRSRTTSSLSHRCSNSSTNNPAPIGRKCIKCSTWDTAWKSIWRPIQAADVISIAAGLGLEAQIVGRVEASDNTELTIRKANSARLSIRYAIIFITNRLTT